jgi:CheY-like chemotaxis protein
MILLCVDDDPDDVFVFCEALKEVDPGANCIVASNGQQAMDILGAGLLPDVIFLDINMPIVGGMETLKLIKADGRFNEIPVIMYSTTINPKEIDAFKEAGAAEFLVKPSHFRKLCEEIRQVMER